MPRNLNASKKRKPPPAGFDLVRADLLELENRMEDAQTANRERMRKVEETWVFTQTRYEKTRLIYDRLRDGTIGEDVLKYCFAERIIDKELYQKWRVPGYDRLCCLKCARTDDKEHGTTCICRLPREKLQGQEIQCPACGCRGCCSSDYKTKVKVDPPAGATAATAAPAVGAAPAAAPAAAPSGPAPDAGLDLGSESE